MRKEMTYEEFVKVLKYVTENHKFGSGIGKGIKYVTPTFDLRNGKIHCITFSGWNGEKVFSIINENKDKNLYAWVVEWLTEGNVKIDE
jgi:hypothetical protein